MSARYARTLIACSVAAVLVSGFWAAPGVAAALDGAVTLAALEVLEGSIKSVETERSRFVLLMEDDRELTITINAETKYTIDGKEATRDEALKAGAKAKVTCDEDRVASRVAIATDD